MGEPGLIWLNLGSKAGWGHGAWVKGHAGPHPEEQKEVLSLSVRGLGA